MKKIILVLLSALSISLGASKPVLDAEVAEAMKVFERDIKGSMKFLKQSKGYLIFPKVIKAGLVIGGEYGEGVLVDNNPDVPNSYYSMTSASIGLQAGIQKTTYIIAFTTDKMLYNFKVSNGIEGSFDGSITLAKWGKSKDISSLSFEKPIIMFAFNEMGLMYNLNVKGTKFKKLEDTTRETKVETRIRNRAEIKVDAKEKEEILKAL